MSTIAVNTNTASRTKARARRLLQLALRYGIYLVFFGLCAVIATISPGFLTGTNLSNVLLQTSAIGIITVGMTFVIIVRGIDLSVGAIVALGSGLGVGMIKMSNQPWYVGAGVMIGLGTCIGLVNGFSASKLHMPAFLVTLATSTIAGGLVIAASGGHIWYGLPKFFQVIGMGHIGPLRNPVAIMFAVFVLGHLLLSHTVYGRRVYAVGSNPETARVSGIRVERVVLLAFVLCGSLAGLASLVLTARMDTFTPSMGSDFAFSAIAASVIGGVSMFGGEGNMGGTLIGVLMMGVINNALNLLNVSAFYQDIARGAVIFTAVLLDTVRRHYAEISQ